MIRMKPILMFLVILAGLAISGYWLNAGGWLHVPRVLDVPAVLGGEERAGMPSGQPGGEAGMDRPMPDDASQFASSDSAEGVTAGAFPEGGRSPEHESNGLNWDMLPSVLANLWIIALIITGIVYSVKLLTIIARSLSSKTVPAQV